MAKRSVPATASRKAVVDDEEEDEVVVVSTKKKTTAPIVKSRTNGKATVAKATVAKKPAKAGSATEIKNRAAKFAERKGIEALAEAKAYKNFDVAFYAKFLKGKGYDVTIDEEGDNYTLST